MSENPFLMSPLAIACIALGASVAFVLTAYLRRWRWTGFANAPGAGEAGVKTLWDWLQLLLIPVGLAVALFALNDAQTRRAESQESQRAERERSIAADARRDDTLRVYLQQMADLMRQSRGLKAASRAADLRRTIARTLTLTVLRRLDPERKGLVLQFLAEAGLVSVDSPRVDLAKADLRRITLRELSSVDLSGADLRQADFHGALLSRVHFNGSDVGSANFRGAFLEEPQFIEANTRGANFSSAFLILPEFDGACLTASTFADAEFFAGSFRGASGHSVSFAGVNLRQGLIDFTAHSMTGVRVDHRLVNRDGRPVRFPESGGRCERRSAAPLPATGSATRAAVPLPAELRGTWISTGRVDDAELIYIFRTNGTYRHVGVLVQKRGGGLFTFQIEATGIVTTRGRRLVLHPRSITHELYDPERPNAGYRRPGERERERYDWSIGARGRLILRGASGTITVAPR